MWSKSINKTILIAGLLALVLAVGLLTKTEIGQGYFSWLRAGLSGVNLSTSQLLAPDQEPEKEVFDLSDLNFSSIEPKEEAKEIVLMPKQTSQIQRELTLDEAQKQIEEISRKVDQIGNEVGKLVVLNDIMSQLDQISREAQEIGQKIGEPDSLTDLQSQIENIAEKANVLSQQIAIAA